ncbi:MAG: DUF2939 domain-containing protein [Syntrophobacterales bacterium]|jgi:hypothetical protein|nr:DUF2939 domain-containing protein [Syntrophobacterales bacterium]
MKKGKVILVSGVILLLMVLAFIYLKTTPYYSIYRFILAVSDHDAEAAMKYVDIDSVTESLAKSLFPRDETSTGLNKGIASAVSTNMLSIKEGVRLYLVSVIRGQGSIPLSSGSTVTLGNLDIHDVNVGIIWHLRVRREGNTASVEIKSKGVEAVKMRKTDDGYWKFTEVLIERYGKE